MLNGNNRDDLHVQSFGFESNIDHHLINATVREKQKTIWRTKNEVAKDHLAEALHVLKEHGLSLSIGADNEVVKRERQIVDRMEARETPMTREHLFDKDPRVARAEEMDQAIARDGLRAKLGSAFDGVHLRRFDPVEDRFGLGYVIDCCS